MIQIKIVEVGSKLYRSEDRINATLKKLQNKGYFIQDIKYHETKFSQYCTIMYDDNTYPSRSGDDGDFLGAYKISEAKRKD